MKDMSRQETLETRIESVESVESVETSQHPNSPQIVDGPWQIIQGNKIAGYVWSFEVKNGGVTVGTIEHWFIVTALNGNSEHAKFMTASTWTVGRYAPGGADYNRGTAANPNLPPVSSPGPAVTYQHWTAMSSVTSVPFSR